MHTSWLRVALLVGAAAALSSGCDDSQLRGVTSDPRAPSCGTCHATQAAAWETSRHASSTGSPVFQALLPRVKEAWGEDARARCVTCHSPGHGGDTGIGCVACHAATGNTAERDGKLLVDLGQPLSGPFSDATETPAHGSRRYELLESPVLCGTCHEITGPGLLSEPTLTEYRASSAASSGASPRTCASCHLPPLDAAPIATGESRLRARADHAFVGVDPPWGAALDVRTRSAGRTAALLSSALVLRATASPDHGVDVTLENGAGHAVPTGVAFLRRIWVDVVFSDAAGRQETSSQVLVLGAIPTKGGAPTALITDADAVENNVLAPSATARIRVSHTQGLRAPVRAVVHLRARAIDPGTLTALGLSARQSEVPTHEVLSVDVALP